MRKKVFFLILGLIFIQTASVFAQVSIKAEVDKKDVTTDDFLTYRVIVTSSQNLIPALELPKFEGFRVISQGQSQSMSFSDQGVNSVIAYNFILTPDTVGDLKIGPASIKIKDKLYSTDAMEIKVTTGKKPKMQKQEEPPLPKKPLPLSDEPQVTI